MNFKVKFLSNKNLKKEILYNQLFKLLNPDMFWEWGLINFLCTFIALENVCVGLPGVYGCHTKNPFTYRALVYLGGHGLEGVFPLNLQSCNMESGLSFSDHKKFAFAMWKKS